MRRRTLLAAGAALALLAALLLVRAPDRAEAGPGGASPVVFTTGGNVDRFALGSFGAATALSFPAALNGEAPGPVAISVDAKTVIAGWDPLRGGGSHAEIIDVATGTVRAVLTLDRAQSVVALVADPTNAGVAYALLSAGEVLKLNVGASPAVAGVVFAANDEPGASMVTTPDGSHLLVGLRGEDILRVEDIDIATHAETTFTNLTDTRGFAISDVAMAPKGNEVYFLLANVVDGPGARLVAAPYPLSATGDQLALSWAANTQVVDLANALTVSPDGTQLYVAGGNTGLEQGAVEEHLASTGAFERSDTISSGVPANGESSEGFADIAEAPDRSRLVVVGFDNANGADTAFAVNPSTLAFGPSTRVTGAAAEPASVAITPDQAPVAKVHPAAGTAGTPLVLSAAGSSVAYGSIVKYVWSFGDGTSATTGGPQATHTYAAAGVYTVRVTETDSAGTSVPPASFVASAVNGPGTTPYLRASASATAVTSAAISPHGQPPPTTMPPTTSTTVTTSRPGHPTLTLNPAVGPPGTVVTVTGAGFPPHKKIRVAWSTHTGAVTITSDGHGRLPATTLLVIQPDLLGPRNAVSSTTPPAANAVAKAPFLVVASTAEPGSDQGSFLFRTEGS